MFLQEKGLCAALKKCCFYADKTRLVQDSMAKLRERLAQMQKLFESNQGWFKSWFSKSPWLTTLLSSLMRLIEILLMILTFGPYIINRLLQFVREKISVVQALALTK